MKKKSITKRPPQKRVSKAQWLQCALDTLENEGIDGVKIERLARNLGIAKAGFYWHFSGRDELLSEMLEFWIKQYTEVVTEGSPTLIGSPQKRLLEVMKMISEHKLAKYELPMRSWAETDPVVARAVRRVYKLRLQFLESIFKEIGFRGIDVEMRAKMLLSYFTFESTLFPSPTKAKREKLMKKQLNWFCQK